MGNMLMITHQMPYASLAAGGLLQWQCGAVGHLQKHKMVRVVGAHKQQKVDHLWHQSLLSKQVNIVADIELK